MVLSTALKKENPAKKLSTESLKSAEAIPFDRQGLVQELLSLGNPKLDLKIAETLSREVEAALRSRSSSRWNPELISELVQFKLQEMGLLDLPRRASRRPENARPEAVAKPPRNLFAQDETTDFLFPSREPVKNREEDAPLSNLQKFLRRPPNFSSRPVTFAKPLPPKAELKLSQDAAVLEALFPEIGAEARLAAYEASLERIAQAAAAVERRYASDRDSETLAIEFFNAMANREFYPHVPSLLGHGHSNAHGAHWVRLPLTHGIRSQDLVLHQAKEIWERSASVLFDLNPEMEGDQLAPESFERFIHGIERSLLELPDTVAIPRSVGLSLKLTHPHAEALVDLALSGKYYPKFSFQLLLPLADRDSEAAAKPAEFGLPGFEAIKKTWKKSEPSIAFLDFVSEAGCSPHKPMEALRPGGGPALGPLEVCNLGSLNLSIVGAGEDVDWAKLRRMIRSGVHFLENLIDATDYPTEEIAERSQANRKIGLGVMGFAELLIKLGIPYDSEDAQSLAEKIMRFVHEEASLASQSLAEERGVFPNFTHSALKAKGLRLRHASLTSIVTAPSLAALADVTPGIQPLHEIVERGEESSLLGARLRPLPLLQEICKRRKLWSPELEQDILQKRSVRGSMAAPKPLRRLFALVSEIAWEWPLRIQAAFQKYSDGAIDQVLSLPEEENLKTLLDMVGLAQTLGVQQLRFHQNPAVETQDEVAASPETSPIESEEPVAETTVDEEIHPEPVQLQEVPAEEIAIPVKPPVLPDPRPEVLVASRRIIQTGCGPMTVTLGREGDRPFELEARLGKAGGCANAQNEAISRLVSLLLGVGVDNQLIQQELRGIRCPAAAIDRGEKVLSCSDAIAKVFAREMKASSEEAVPNLPSDTPEIPHLVYSADDEITAVVAKDSIH